MTPTQLSMLITEDIKFNNGLLFEQELTEAISYIELARLVQRLPQGQVDQEQIQRLTDVINNIAGFAEFLQKFDKRPASVDDLIQVYSLLIQKFDGVLDLRPKVPNLTNEQIVEYGVGLLLKLIKSTEDLSVRARFANVSDKAIFSRYATNLIDRIRDGINRMR